MEQVRFYLNLLKMILELLILFFMLMVQAENIYTKLQVALLNLHLMKLLMQKNILFFKTDSLFLKLPLKIWLMFLLR